MLKLLVKGLLILFVVLLCESALSSFLKVGLRRYNQLDRKAELLFIGHSHTENGIDDLSIEKSLRVPVSKYFVPGANSIERLVMLRNYLNEQPHSPRVVVYDVDAKTFDKAPLSANFYVQFFPYMDLPVVADYIRGNGAAWDEFICRKFLKLMRYNDSSLMRCSLKGYSYPHVDVSADIVNVSDVRTKLKAIKPVTYRANNLEVKAFEETIKLVHEHNAVLILLFIPTLDIYNQFYSDAQKHCMDILKNYVDRNKNVILLDYNQKYEHRTDMFHDAAHMNKYGQKIVSENLIIDLKRLNLF